MIGDSIPQFFCRLLSEDCIEKSDIFSTDDGFFLVFKSLSDILKEKEIFDVPDPKGESLLCDRFFDDWFLYAVSNEKGLDYGLLKFREQEHDAEEGMLADGDTPGVTVSFISFRQEALFSCLLDPTKENRKALNFEINRVVAHRGQKHSKIFRRYFVKPQSQGSYLIAALYIRRILSFGEEDFISVPDCYQKILQQSLSYKNVAKYARIPRFMDSLNEKAGKRICSKTKIFIENRKQPSEWECLAVLATHTGNTSVYSFAAEIEYHARFLFFLARVKIPFFGKSIYASAIRADMTIDDNEFEGPAPFYRDQSKIVKRQVCFHPDYALEKTVQSIIQAN